MVNDWEEASIHELPIHIGDGNYSSKYPKSSDFVDSGVPFITASDFNNGRISSSDFRYISEEQHSTLLKGHLKSGDVLIVTRGNGVGDIAWVDDAFDGCNINAQLVLLRADGEVINNSFLYYLLSSKEYKRIFLSYASGSAQPQLPIKALRIINLKYPPLPEQKAIAHILGSLDDKIELNRRMNETLESMAQALFKSWFVDFDPVIDNALAVGNAIPDEFMERAEQRKGVEKKDNSDIQSLFPDEFEFTEEMGWIPKGWEVKCIKDIGKVVTGKTPPKKIDNAYSEDGTPFITPTDIDDLPFVVYTNRYLSEDGVKAVKNSRISAGSICVTCIGSQMGKTTISPFASVSNQQINSITDCSQFWRNYLFFNLRRRREEIFHLGSSGSTMPILNKSNFEAFPILCPSEQLLSSLDSYFQGSIDSILEKTKQNQTLAKLRDTLLPKLMSGELRIPDTL